MENVPRVLQIMCDTMRFEISLCCHVWRCDLLPNPFDVQCQTAVRMVVLNAKLELKGD